MSDSTTTSDTFEVQRDHLSETRIFSEELPEPGPGEALLRVDAFALTANNITYGVAGDSIGYWRFFPAIAGHADGWGRLPVWGFADVVGSSVDGMARGDRFYGYYPMASHLMVRPQHVGDRGFSDGSAHRAELPQVYNAYTRTSTDPAYHPDFEGMQMLFRPLFMTSFFIDDWLAGNDWFGARTVVLASASSKTAFGLAWLLKQRGDVRVVGLTSAAHVNFVRSLGCYDQTVAYEDLTELAVGPTVLVDMAGNSALRARIHQHLLDDLKYSCSVGVTHWDSVRDTGHVPLPGPEPVLFFAPTHIDKRMSDWGPEAMAERLAAAWQPFMEVANGWITVWRERGAEGVEVVYQNVLHNRVRASEGQILSL